VRHARFDIAVLAVEQVPVPMKAGYLLVAETDDGVHPQWEALVYAFETAPIAQGRYRVDLTTLDGRVLGGDAVLVRSIDGTHVLRGAGPLEGIGPDDLDRG
jgi:hypothetical protein